MRSLSHRALVAVCAAATVVALQSAGPTQEPPLGPGMIRPRPAEGRQPEFPPPSITDYKPRSTLKVPEHPTPRAKFPVVDFHSHQPTPIAPAEFDRVVAGMDQNNLRLLVNASGASGDELARSVEAIRRSTHHDRMVQFAAVDFRNVGPGWGARAAQQLEADIKAGALGLGEIPKSLGLRIRKADGSLLAVDDPDLDPIWETCARLHVPVFIHTAEPQEFFEPIDVHNERWLELALYKDRRYPAGQFPRFEELAAQRDRLFRRHPKTTFVTAHFGWHANDLARLGRLLDELPNVYTETGAILAELGREPRAAHDFFVKYQDRILFGKDSFQPDEFPYYWRTFETADEYFDYYRDYHAFWKLYGMALPDQVLQKVYWRNAVKLVPALRTAAVFPE